MRKMHFSSDRRGRKPVIEYIEESERQNDKDGRIKLAKIRAYVRALAANGTELPAQYGKHLDGEIWELRPIRDRILFAGWVNGSYALPHTFAKKPKNPEASVGQGEKGARGFSGKAGAGMTVENGFVVWDDDFDRARFHALYSGRERIFDISTLRML